MRTNDLDFSLPAELIAQQPADRRDGSRLLHYRRQERSIEHRSFEALPQLLRAGDLMVVNDARVLPARFALVKATGGIVEGLFLEQLADGTWIALLKNLGPMHVDSPLHFCADRSVAVHVVNRKDEAYVLRVAGDQPAEALLARIGRMPLPPYIRREKGCDASDAVDAERYQTIFAAASGSVAAPTAGLHFTPQVFAELDKGGIERATVTLHVGAGTFKPVTADTLAEHAMHTERYEISDRAAAQLNAAKSSGRRIVAVGTTCARVLESHADDKPFAAGSGKTSILIYPPYRWRHVGALLTNFHLPRSTLIALVAAFVGLDEQRRIYREAIERRYRFFSYGDAMFIE